MVISHARTLLSGDGVVAAPGDLRNPDAILASPSLTRVIDLREHRHFHVAGVGRKPS